LVEFGAALAGLTLVTVNPAYLAEELAFVLKQSRARGIIVQDTYRNRDLIATVEVARKTLGDLREVVALSPGRISQRAATQGDNCRRSNRRTLPRFNTRREQQVLPKGRG
jgi:fatty-acyl-CoA synthase